LASDSYGIHRALALALFETQQVTLAQGARLAGLSLEEFLELLRRSDLAAVSYPPEDLADEIEAAR
jgi:predicted HTH domain antitoxin